MSNPNRRSVSTVDHIAVSLFRGRASWLARRPVDDFGEEIKTFDTASEGSIVDDFGNEYFPVSHRLRQAAGLERIADQPPPAA